MGQDLDWSLQRAQRLWPLPQMNTGGVKNSRQMGHSRVSLKCGFREMADFIMEEVRDYDD